MNSEMFGLCVSCAKSRTCREGMIKETRLQSMAGVAYWQMVLKQICQECRTSKRQAN